jgi:NAD(P)-dependent dehydrogenase (short-subunit alcohol dehydrogenase family)
MSRHVGKSIIVTGGAGAIGFATAQILAGEGADVMLVDINGEALEQKGAELRERGVEVEAICADCSHEESVQRYVDAAMRKFGRIDGFFNNAGVEGKLAPTYEYEVAEFDRIIAINLRSMFLGLRFVLPVMVKQGSGAVVNTASIASELGLAGACAYNASKHGVVGLTRTAASEVGQKGVRVNCVEPGVIETPLLRGMLEQMFPTVEAGLQKLGQVATLNRIAQPSEVGRVVSFLLSNDASFVNGAAWSVDGGAMATIRNDI